MVYTRDSQIILTLGPTEALIWFSTGATRAKPPVEAIKFMPTFTMISDKYFYSSNTTYSSESTDEGRRREIALPHLFRVDCKAVSSHLIMGPMRVAVVDLVVLFEVMDVFFVIGHVVAQRLQVWSRWLANRQEKKVGRGRASSVISKWRDVGSGVWNEVLLESLTR